MKNVKDVLRSTIIVRAGNPSTQDFTADRPVDIYRVCPRHKRLQEKKLRCWINLDFQCLLIKRHCLPFLQEEAPSNMEVQSLMVLQKLRMDLSGPHDWAPRPPSKIRQQLTSLIALAAHWMTRNNGSYSIDLDNAVGGDKRSESEVCGTWVAPYIWYIYFYRDPSCPHFLVIIHRHRLVIL